MAVIHPMMLTRPVLGGEFFVPAMVVSVRMHVPMMSMFMDMMFAKQVIPDMGCPMTQPYQYDSCEKRQDGE